MLAKFIWQLFASIGATICEYRGGRQLTFWQSTSAGCFINRIRMIPNLAIEAVLRSSLF